MNIYQETIALWGEEKQIDMAIEEMAELTKALLKFRRFGYSLERYKDVVEELADVQIMLRQLITIYDDGGQGMRTMERKKLEELQELIDTEKKRK